LKYATSFGDIKQGEPYLLSRNDLEKAFSQLPIQTQQLLQRTANRVRKFASAQKSSLHEMQIPIEGGIAGHSVRPLERVGCYAPGKKS